MAGLPEHGQPIDEIMARLRSMQVNDADYHNARTWGLIYHGGPDVDAVLHEVGEPRAAGERAQSARFPEPARDAARGRAHDRGDAPRRR